VSTVLTINSVTISVPSAVRLDKLVAYVRGGTPTLSFRAIQTMPTLPDPYLGHSVSLTISGTTVFVGRVVSVAPEYGDLGWVRAYQCVGLRGLADHVPLTDATSLVDNSAYNLQLEDPGYQASRAGRTVGQILTSILTMVANANGLNAYGIGAYTGLPTTPALPSATVTDLAALTVIPPSSVYVQGEKILNAIESFLGSWAPNHVLWIDPTTGALRFLDQRSFTNHTLTLGSDPIDPPQLSRDVSQCSQRVEVRGSAVAVMGLLKVSQSTLTEDFAWGSFTNAQAKANWTPSQFSGTGNYQDTGTITCPDTQHVIYTSANSLTFTLDELDQSGTGLHATVNLFDSGHSGITSIWTARVTANTATSGGTSTFTLDAALPVLTYDHATLSWVADNAGLVWRLYKIADTSLWPLVVAQSTYPQPFIMPGGGGAVLTSTPMGAVFAADGAMFPSPFTYLGSGLILFAGPTYSVFGQAPSDVWVLLPFNTGSNVVYYPPNTGGPPPLTPAYGGTSNSVEGLTDTLVVTVPEWRDPANATAMSAYASDVFDSVKDAVIEGNVIYHGLYTTALPMGQALEITASGYTAPYGWASISMPVVECEVDWIGTTLHTTRMRVSTRRSPYSAEAFLHPNRTGITWGPPEGTIGGNYSGFGGSLGASTLGSHGVGSFGDASSIPTSLGELGISSTPAEALMSAGADPFGGLNPEWTAQQQAMFAPPEGGEGGGE
jgi:hypothetical protein